MHWQLLTAVLVVAAPAPPEKEKKDDEKIQGNWTVVSMERGGMAAPAEKIAMIKVTFKDGTLTINDGGRDEKAKFKIDATKKPKAIDLIPEKPGRTEQVPGIYELKGDELKICFTKEGGGRPTEFSSNAGTEQVLIVFKREKKDK